MIRVKINQPNASEMFLKALKENKVIAYPTDTIYGVGTAVTNDKGIDKGIVTLSGLDCNGKRSSLMFSIMDDDSDNLFGIKIFKGSFLVSN